MSTQFSNNTVITGVQRAMPLRHQGFTLIEVLITIVILSVGLLGVANLQMLGLNYNNNAYHRSQAVQLAYDIVERMRMNPTGVAAGSYSGGSVNVNSNQRITLISQYSYSSSPGLGTKPTCNKINYCNSASLASFDLHEWREGINDALPKLNDSSNNAITMARITSLGGNRFSIFIQWGEKVEDIDSDRVFEDDFQARNFTTYVQL